jgi:hypothetical protein
MPAPGQRAILLIAATQVQRGLYGGRRGAAVKTQTDAALTRIYAAIAEKNSVNA